MSVALVWPEPTRHEEASGDDSVRRTAAAGAAGADIRKDRNALERQAVQDLLKYLGDLKKALTHRLLTGAGSLTDFKRFTLQALLADTDRLIADAQRRIAMMTERLIQGAADLGDSHAEEPLIAAKLDVQRSLPGLDQTVVRATFQNTVKLLTPPMVQFADDAKRAIRAVALAGDNKFEQIQKLRDRIAGQGMAAAQYKAERIIRTELGRTFNEATYERLVAMSVQYPFLKKVWRATKDSRTRTGHREAGQAYARGRGVDIRGAFVVNVYDERPGKSPVLMGKVAMRFPVDPLAVPQGKLAAAATIMCRCNAAVDFDPDGFRQHTRSQVSLALGGVQPPAPIPPPVPPVIPKPAPVPTPKPRKPRTPRVAKPKPPVIPVATGATSTTVGVPTQVVPGRKGPKGTRVGDAYVPGKGLTAAVAALQKRVMDAIAQVHGDGPLTKIPFLYTATRKFLGCFKSSWGSQPVSVELTRTGNGKDAHPLNTIAHETGHFLDLDGIGKSIGQNFRSAQGFAMEVPTNTRQHTGHLSGDDLIRAERANRICAAVDKFREAAKNSDTIQAIAKLGQSPAAKQGSRYRRYISYLLTTKETWARAYAQYVAVRSNDPAMMAELRAMQAKVASTRANPAQVGVYDVGRTAHAPNVWADDEFVPIAEAIDELFEALDWRG